jgi:hypothetical protein
MSYFDYNEIVSAWRIKRGYYETAEHMAALILNHEIYKYTAPPRVYMPYMEKVQYWDHSGFYIEYQTKDLDLIQPTLDVLMDLDITYRMKKEIFSDHKFILDYKKVMLFSKGKGLTEELRKVIEGIQRNINFLEDLT